jgi:hypothetical protein
MNELLQCLGDERSETGIIDRGCGPLARGLCLALYGRDPQITAFDNAHEVANSIDLVSDDVGQLEARNLIFYRDYYFKAIKPVGSEIVAKARLVRHALRVDSEMPGYDFADFDVEVALHRRSLS